MTDFLTTLVIIFFFRLGYVALMGGLTLRHLPIYYDDCKTLEQAHQRHHDNLLAIAECANILVIGIKACSLLSWRRTELFPFIHEHISQINQLKNDG